MNEQSLPIQEILAVLWRRRALIGVVFFTGLLTVTVLTWLQPPVYRATAKLMVTSSRATLAVSPDADERPRVDPVTEADLSSEVAMLGSLSLLREVLEPYWKDAPLPEPTITSRIMQVIRYPLSIPSRVYRAIHGLPPDSAMDSWVNEAASHLSIAELGRSNLIEVAYEDRMPSWAADLVNNLVSHHVERHVKLNQQASAQEFYESQRTLLTEKLSAAELARRTFYDRESLDSAANGLPTLRKRIAKLETNLADAETELAENSAEAEFLSKAMTNLPARGGAAAPSSSSMLIKNRLVELELQRSQLMAQYAPTSVKLADVDRQIAEARRMLAAEPGGAAGPGDPNRLAIESNLTARQGRAAALQARTASLREQLETSRGQLGHLESIASEQERLEQEVSTAKQSLATYLKKEEQARFSNALDESRIVNVTLVERATVPNAPLQTKRTMTILLGAVASLAAALGLAFVRDYVDPTVKGGAEAQRISGLPLLAEIPS